MVIHVKAPATVLPNKKSERQEEKLTWEMDDHKNEGIRDEIIHFRMAHDRRKLH